MQPLRLVPAAPTSEPRPTSAVRSAIVDARALQRRQLYLGEGMTVTVTGDDGAVDAEAIDLTPEGMGLAVLAGTGVPSAGARVKVEHTGRGLAGVVQHAEVVSVTEGTYGGRARTRIGLRFVAERAAQVTRDVRASERFRCGATFPVMAAATSPLFFREWLSFRVTDICRGGMTLATSLRNKGLLPGMELDFSVTLPMSGAFAVRGRITSILREVSDDQFRVGVAFHEPSRAFLQAFAEYLLLADKTLTPARLRDGGLLVGSVEKAVTYDYARPDEYEDILDLRLRSHQQEGRLESFTTEDMESPYDACARHIVCRFGRALVGYVRLIYVDGDPAKSQYVSAGGHEVPEWLWEAGFVEAGAGATDPAFQRAGLFVPLMQHCVRIGMQSGFRYMIGACDDDLLAMYGEMGFTVLETREVEPKEGWKFRSHLFVLDMEALRARTAPGKFVDAMAAAADFAAAG